MTGVQTCALPISSPTTTTIRLLISHLLIGSVIGKGGAKIRQIQDASGARMVASKEMLPQSTERIVEVSGAAESIRLAVSEISKCLIEDWDRSQGTVLYHPGAEGGMIGNGFPSGGQQPYAGRRISSGGQFARRTSGGEAGNFVQRERSAEPEARRSTNAGEQASSDPNYREQKISIPSDMVYVFCSFLPLRTTSLFPASAGPLRTRAELLSFPSGCIIGRAGTKINEIRRLSGSKISIAKTAHDETGERMFVISGLPEYVPSFLSLIAQLTTTTVGTTRRPSSSSTTSSRARRSAGFSPPASPRRTEPRTPNRLASPLPSPFHLLQNPAARTPPSP